MPGKVHGSRNRSRDWALNPNRKILLRRLPYSVCRIHATNITTLSTLVLTVGLQNRISPSPAEPYCADFVRARRHAHGIHEAVDQGPGDAFAVFDEPWTKSGRHDSGILYLVDYAECFLRLERGFDIIQKGQRQGVALMKVRHVHVEARFGVFVGKEADVGEFIAEDWELACQQGMRRDEWQMREPTVGDKYYRLGVGVVLRLRYVSREAADLIFSAGRLALMHLATQAATAHPYVLRHCNYLQSWSIEVGKGR